MSGLNNISAGEWEIMKCLWECEYSTLTELTMKLKDKKNWSNRAIQMMLSRMEKKQLITAHKEFSPIHYIAKVDEKKCIKNENITFLDKVYNGSKTKMFKNIGSDLTKEELEEVKLIFSKLK